MKTLWDHSTLSRQRISSTCVSYSHLKTQPQKNSRLSLHLFVPFDWVFLKDPTDPPRGVSNYLIDSIHKTLNLEMDASYCYLSPTFRSPHWKMGRSQTALYSCKCETVLKQDPWLWKMTAQSRLESPWSKSSHILNNVSVWTVEFLNRKSKHTLITSNTGSADLRVFKNYGLLQSGSQTNPIRELPTKTKRFNPKLFLALNLIEILKLIVLFQSGETSRYFSLVFRESETLLLRLLDFCKSLSRLKVSAKKKSTNSPIMDWVT